MNGRMIDPRDVSPDMAQEMLNVGIVPSDELDPIGTEFFLGTHEVVVTGWATKVEFLKAIERENLPIALYIVCPMPFYLKIGEIYV